ncbi:MAG: glycosyl hydrolase [Bacteroidales bacterium]|nr:glycosyl hydrolase [Bacteroides sp.]MCM1198455.1 hypothetical protein [Clostridium sp.]MCM1501817.1 glycosyl hydrolase [Bacteroidales bacterium]
MTSLFLTLALFVACDNKISYDDYVIPSDAVYTAVPANDFLSSIGVNSSIDSRGESLEKTLECMQYIGARWIRSGYGAKGYSSFDYLMENGGIKFSMAIGTGSKDGDMEKVLEAARYLKEKDALIAMEGNNEPNNWTIYYEGEQGGGAGTWMPVAKLHRDFYAAIKADPLLKDVDVWSLTEAGAETDNVGVQFLTIPAGAGCLLPAGTVFADVANVHNYFIHPNFPALQNNQTWAASDPSSACRVDGLYGNHGVTWGKGYQGYTEQECMQLRKVTTETGTTIDGENGPVTEEIQALMYMSCYLSQYARGWEYTSMYILRDRSDESGNQTFGFYTPAYEPRLSAHYLHNLTTVLKDDKSIEHPGRLSYSIPDKPETVHTLLLQKYDGTYELVVWGERYAGGKDEIVVKLDKEYSNINIYDPTKGTDVVETAKNTSEVSLTMTNHPYILEFK